MDVNNNVTKYQTLDSSETFLIKGQSEITIEGIFEDSDTQVEVKFKNKRLKKKIWKSDYEKVSEILGDLSKITYDEYRRQLFAEVL